MRIAVDSNDLIDALKNSAVARTSTMAVLSHVLLRATANELVIEATDLSARTCIVVAAEITEPGEVVLPALRLSAAADGGGTVTIHGDGRVVRGRSRFHLGVIPAADFPREQAADFEAVTTDPEALARTLAQAAYAPEDGDVRAFCRALVIEPGQVSGGNGHKVVRLAVDYNGPTIMLPVAMLPRLKGLLHKDSVLSVSNVREGRAGAFRVKSGNHTVSIVCIDSAPFNVKPIVDAVSIQGPAITIKRRELLDAVRRFAPFVTTYAKGDKGFVFSRADGAITISDCADPSNVDDVSHLAEKADGEFRVGISHRYAVDVLSALDSDLIEIYPAAHERAALFMPQGGDIAGGAHLIAPQAIK